METLVGLGGCVQVSIAFWIYSCEEHTCLEEQDKLESERKVKL